MSYIKAFLAAIPLMNGIVAAYRETLSFVSKQIQKRRAAKIKKDNFNDRESAKKNGRPK